MRSWASPVDPLVWQYDVSIPDRLSLVGKVAPGDDWSHQVTINVSPGMADLLRPWRGNVPAFDLRDARWTGRLRPTAAHRPSGPRHPPGRAGQGVGRLGRQHVQRRRADHARSTSTVDTGQKAAPESCVTGGALGFDGKTVRLQQPAGPVAGGEARVDASFDTATTGGNAGHDLGRG